ncbi:MAG: PAS domain S-box protein [Chloroflexales bacterium]|nr:PAS domain S-box protein [Chloroflexales bacterium]
MDAPTPDLTEQLRAENQRLRARIAVLETCAVSNTPAIATAPAAPPLWFDSVSDAIFVADATWTIQHWNQAAAQLYGWASAEVVGRPISELIAVARYLDDDSDEGATQTLRTTGSWRGIFVQRTRDGREVVVEGATRALTDAQGTITGYIGINRDVTARKQAEQALCASEANLRAILASTTQAYLLLDAELRLVQWNELAEAMAAERFGRAHQAGAPISDYMPPETVPTCTALMRRALAGEHIQTELDVSTPAVPRWLVVTYAPVREPDGQIRGICVSTLDVSAHRQAELELRASETRYRILFETMAQGVVYHDSDGQIIAANPAAEHILGLTLSQMQGRTSLDPRWRAIHEDGTPFPGEAHPAMVALRTGQEVRDVVMGIYHPGLDVYRWISIQAVPHVRLGAAGSTQVYALFDDITARRQAEQARDAVHHQLDAIVEALDEGVIALRHDGSVALINQSARELMLTDPTARPRTVRELSAMNRMTLYDTTGQPLAADDLPFLRVLRGERFKSWELKLRPAGSDEERWVLISGMTVAGAEGEHALGIVTRSDITEHKRAELALAAHAEALSKTNAALTRALTLKDEFLAMMSHELRTPLNTVLGVTEALEEELYGPIVDRQRQALGRVTQSARHLLTILSDILDLTHIEAGKAVLDVRAVDVDILCRTALQFVQAPAQTKGIQLFRTVAGEVEGLRGDERRLTQILTNLLENAVKFTPAGGRVGLEVSGDASEEHIAFTVWDTGIGIAPEDMGRLFQPFTQIDGRLSRAYEGIGLGLTLVRRLAEMHGGSVSLESTVGQGSRFTVRLPWSPGENIAPATPRGPAPTTSTWVTPPRLVIADDHEITLQFYAELLGEQGCQVALARTGVETVTQVRATRPDVAIIDVQMPELDGLSAIRQIRADPDVEATPIIALTALAMPGDRERCLAAGASVYLAKPVGIRTLLATIAEALACANTGRTGE